MVRRPQIAEAKFVDGRRRKRLGISEHQNLRSTKAQRVETRDGSAAIRIRAVVSVVVDVPVGREQSERSSVLINANSAFIVPQSLLCLRGVEVGAARDRVQRLRYKRQQAFGCGRE